MPGRVVKRKLITVRVPPLPLEKVYEKLSSAVRSGYAEIRVEGGKAFIEVVGTAAQIKDTWAQLKKSLTELWELYELQSRGSASIAAIVREAGRTFPPEALAAALELRGYRARLSEDKSRIETDAPAELVVELARGIAEVIDSLRFRVRGTAAKRLVAAVSVGLGVDPETVLEYGLKMRVFEEAEDGIRLREEWRRALRKLAVMLKASQSLPAGVEGAGGREDELGAGDEDTEA